MLDTRHTFNKHIATLVTDNFPEVKFYSEPAKQKLEYPCIVLHWSGQRRTKALAMWTREVQFDILYPQWRRMDCDMTTQQLAELLHIAADTVGHGQQRRIPKLQFINPTTRELYTSPQPYTPIDSDIQWELADAIEEIEEADKPELMRNMFTLSLLYKNR